MALWKASVCSPSSIKRHASCCITTTFVRHYTFSSNDIVPEVASTSPTYRHLYFNLRGAAEPIRYMLALCKEPYHDIRYPMTASAKGFGIDTMFLQHKEQGTFDANMGQLPILQVVGLSNSHQNSELQIMQVGQSHSIMRFLAHRHDLFGTNEWERAKIDIIYECVRDIKAKWFKVKQNSNSNNQFLSKKRFLEQDLVVACAQLEKVIGLSSTSVWLVGNRVSMADVVVYSMLTSHHVSLMTGSPNNFFDGADPSLLQNSYQLCPRIKASIENVAKIKEIREWEEKRPDTFG
jgi:glutathione S-transferase